MLSSSSYQWPISYIFFLIFILIPVRKVHGKNNCIEISGDTSAFIGGDVTFRCALSKSCAREGSNSSIMWFKIEGNQRLLLLHGRKGRLTIDGDEKTEEWLHISDVSENDKGTYWCQISVNSSTGGKAQAYLSKTELYVLANTGGLSQTMRVPSTAHQIPSSKNDNSTLSIIEKRNNNQQCWDQMVLMWFAIAFLLISLTLALCYIVTLRMQESKEGQKHDNMGSYDIAHDSTEDNLMMSRATYNTIGNGNGIEVQNQMAHNFRVTSYSKLDVPLNPPPPPVLLPLNQQQQQQPTYCNNANTYINSSQLRAEAQQQGDEEESSSDF